MREQTVRRDVISEFGQGRIVRAVIAFCILVMLVGMALRFTNLDSKIFGNDEATTSLHVSGKTIAQYGSTMFDGRERTASDILAFQTPDFMHGNDDVVSSLAVEDPQHPPLYYLLERQWEIASGSSIAERRVVAAIFGCVAIVTAIWFGIELDSRIAGVFVGSFVAASPFAIAYSQVAREYSLWLALTFAASALLIRAFRKPSGLLWFSYAVVSLCGLYTDALFVLVIAAHALALPFIHARPRRVIVGYVVTLAVIAGGYLPWVLALVHGFTHGSVTNNTYLSAGLSFKPFILKWIFNIGSLFYDADYIYPKTAVLIIPGLIVLAVAFVICARSVRKAPHFVVVLSLAAVTVVVLAAPDILHHQQRSTASRYLVPLWVACYASLGLACAVGIRSARQWVQVATLGFVLYTAVLGFTSFSVATKRDTWWVDGSTGPIGPIARAVELADNPIVLYHATWGPGKAEPEVWDFSVVMLANMVDPKTRFIQAGRDQHLVVPTNAGKVFLLDPNDLDLASLRASGAKVEMVAGGSALHTDAAVAALRRTVALEREHQGLATGLTPVPSLWEVRAVKGQETTTERH